MENFHSATYDERSAANEAYRVFYNASLKFQNAPIHEIDFSTFIQYIDQLGISAQHWLGRALILSQYPKARVDAVMEKLAQSYAGRIPDRQGIAAFLSALTDDSYSISYKTEIFFSSIKKSAVEIGSTVKNIAIGGVAIYAMAGLVFLYITMQNQRRGRAT